MNYTLHSLTTAIPIEIMTSFQEPGAGLPAFERNVLNVALKFGTAFLSDQRALKLFHDEANIILEIIDDSDYDFASRQVLVPRYRGMEDSSRNWSMFMVLEHLCQVNKTILRTIDVLRSGIQPRGEIDIADYKPDPDVGAETIDNFREILSTYNHEINRLKPLRGTPSFAHPWFGPLDAHGWLCLAAVHQRIHRKQTRKIAAMLGVA